MRLFVLSVVALLAGLYAYAAFDVFREERRAQDPDALAALVSGPARHPEANLRHLRTSFASGEYSNELKPYLDRALEQAPSFYQSPFLLAAFYANRLEQPERIEQSFEAAIRRFPANGRLHLTFAEWLLTPRMTAPYRAYRETQDDRVTLRESRALEHIATATRLEPELDGPTLEMLARFRIPFEAWDDLIAREHRRTSLVLRVVGDTVRDAAKRRVLLERFLSEATDIAVLRSIESYGDAWGEPEIALEAARRWHALALEQSSTRNVTFATLNLATHYLERGESDRAYELVRETLVLFERQELVEPSADLLTEVAGLYSRRQRFATAESLFMEAAVLTPYRPSIYLGLARNYRAAGELGAARRELAHVIELDPSNEAAHSMIAKME